MRVLRRTSLALLVITIVLLIEVDHADAAPWTYKDQRAVTSVENGVTVIRGARPLRPRLLGPATSKTKGDSLEETLEGRPEVKIVRIKTTERVVTCRKPRRLITHGFQGVRRYNRAFGSFRPTTFGFDDYDRADLIRC
ncbi:MAG: hypothetical protein AAF668_10680 [Pseudomonadota bacterium]